VIDRPNEGADAARGDADAGQILGRFLIGQRGELAFDLGADDHRLGAEMGTRVVLHGGHVTRRVGQFDVLGRLHAFVVPRGFHDGDDRAQVSLGDVAGKDGGFPGEEEKLTQELLLVIAEFQRGGRFAGVEMRDEFFAQGDFGLGRFVAGLGGLGLAILAFLHGGQIGEDQFGIDDLDVADGIDRAGDVMDIGILKAAHDLDDGIDLADVAEELVAEPFTGAGAFDESGDVHKLDGGRHELLGTGELAQGREARIRHRDDAHIRVDGTKWVIGSLRLLRLGDGIKERGFADVGKTDDACGEHGMR
jgi:hypothetical protein